MDNDEDEDEDLEPPEPAFHQAARRGDIAAMERLLAEGADINERAFPEKQGFNSGITPLMAAANSEQGANVATLRWLLDHGADLRAISNDGVTAAFYAADSEWGLYEIAGRTRSTSHADRVRLLLDAGLDPNETIPSGETLLTQACRTADSPLVQLLLERGVSPFGIPDSEHDSQIPLLCAAQSGCAECARLLIAAGVDPNQEGPFSVTTRAPGTPALAYARSPEVARVLIAARARVDTHD